MDKYKFLTDDLPQIIQAVLTVIGALKILSRYTPWKWDDKLFEMLEFWRGRSQK